MYTIYEDAPAMLFVYPNYVYNGIQYSCTVHGTVTIPVVFHTLLSNIIMTIATYMVSQIDDALIVMIMHARKCRCGATQLQLSVWRHTAAVNKHVCAMIILMNVRHSQVDYNNIIACAQTAV